VTPVEYGFAVGARDLLRDTERHGEGIFGTQVVSCDLGVDCHEAFDEYVARAVPDRASPGAEMLGEGEERQVAFGSASQVKLSSGSGSVSSALTGRVGYSQCEGGNDAGPCPFYLGSLTAAASTSMTLNVTCADQSRQRVRVENLVLSLSQPAFGIDAEADAKKGFPAAGLLVETSFDVGREHYRSRRPNRLPVTFDADGNSFDASGLVMNLQVPCNATTGQVTATVTLKDPGDGSSLAAPPNVDMLVPALVDCSGGATALSAAVTDPDGDVQSVRWTIDGVLMAPSVSTVISTGPHELQVTARDKRGAATTDRRSITCQ
jgi:hypothetical protein